MKRVLTAAAGGVLGAAGALGAAAAFSLTAAPAAADPAARRTSRATSSDQPGVS